jgi:hypothetical protein
VREKCFACGGPYHEATGHRFRGFEDVVYCGVCSNRMRIFVRGMMSRKVGKTAGFYEAAATSIREGIYPEPNHKESWPGEDLHENGSVLNGSPDVQNQGENES